MSAFACRRPRSAAMARSAAGRSSLIAGHPSCSQSLKRAFRPLKRHARLRVKRRIFSEDAGSLQQGTCIARLRQMYVHSRRGLELKERGHRGVRPRHHETGSPSGRPEDGSSSGSVRVYFVVRAVWLALRCTSDTHPGDDRLRRGRLVWVVASRGPGRPRKSPGKTNTCGLSRVRPRRLAKTRTMRSRPPQPAARITGIR